MVTPQHSYTARLDIDYPEKLDRFTSFFRLIWIIPIVIILSLLSAVESWTVVTETGETISRSSGGIAAGLFVATMLMIVFRQRYPRWWFDFAREFARFVTRVAAYLFLLTDLYPSTVDEQSVHLEIDYPDVEQELNRWLPLVKWLLVISHFIVLFVLWLIAIVVAFIAWFSILFTGRYPRALFDYVVGSSDGHYEQRRTPSCWSRTATRRSASIELRSGPPRKAQSPAQSDTFARWRGCVGCVGNVG